MKGILKTLENTILKAGKVAIRDFGEIENLQVSRKGPNNFVTSADLKVERIIIEELQKAYPSIGILSEEAGLVKGTNDKMQFILDPIDGTTNFMHGLPFFCISAALVENIGGKKQPLLAVTYAPILGDMYIAEKGGGAYCNNKRLQVSARDNIDESLFACYIAKHNQEYRQKDIDTVQKVKVNARIYGSAALELAFVAAGKLDGMWHGHLKPWDLAAGVLLVQESRGMVSEINGGTGYLDSGSIIAANSSLFEELRKRVSVCYK